jgi:hypothetical protein
LRDGVFPGLLGFATASSTLVRSSTNVPGKGCWA